jgi:(2Fe-2S) ferredoxin
MAAWAVWGGAGKICTNKECKRFGARKSLAWFEELVPEGVRAGTSSPLTKPRPSPPGASRAEVATLSSPRRATERRVLSAQVELEDAECFGECAMGPNVQADGKMFNGVKTKADVARILENCAGGEGLMAQVAAEEE